MGWEGRVARGGGGGWEMRNGYEIYVGKLAGKREHGRTAEDVERFRSRLCLFMASMQLSNLVQS